MNVSLRAMDQKRRTLTVAAWAFAVAAPFLLLAAVSLVIGRNAFGACPVWTDELDYWRGVFSWMKVGGAAGYSGVNEHAALMGTLSVHGFAPLLLYGWFAKLFGWGFSSVVLCNALWISAGALVFVLLNRPKAGTALGLGLSLAVYGPAVLYCATSMTELANYGMLLFYLAFLTRLWRVRREAGEKAGASAPVTAGLPSLILASLTVLFCCAYRITYVGLFLPLIVIACDGRWSGRMALSFLAALLASLFTYYISQLYASPFSAGFLYNLLRVGSPGMAARMFLSHAKANLIDYFIRPTGNAMESLQRWLYCGVAALCLLRSFVWVAKRDGRARVRFGWDGFSFLAFVMLFLPFALVVCLYETNDWSDYRTLAPFLWLVAAAFLIRGERGIPLAYLVGCAAILAVLLTGAPVGAFGDTNRFSATPFTPETQALCEAISYDADADDPYANSVRTDLFNLETVALLDPGIGLQTGWMSEDTVGKSRWILTDYLKFPLEGYRLVLTNPDGSVFRLIEDEE